MDEQELVDEPKEYDAQVDGEDSPDLPEDTGDAPVDEDTAGEDGEGETPEPDASDSEDRPLDEAEGAPAWVKELRQDHRVLKREKRALEKRLAELSGESQQKEAPKQEKPTLEGFKFDEDAYQEALESWVVKKLEVESKEKTEADRWKASLDNYSKLKKSIDEDEFNDSEENVKIELSVIQQGIILKGAKNSALVVYKLGKNDKLLGEFARITDPIEFAFAISNYEKGAGNFMEKEKTKPERVIKPGQHSSSNSSKVESKLLEKARETGNFSELFAFRKKQKQ
jgi:hypothetical protein